MKIAHLSYFFSLLIFFLFSFCVCDYDQEAIVLELLEGLNNAVDETFTEKYFDAELTASFYVLGHPLKASNIKELTAIFKQWWTLTPDAQCNVNWIQSSGNHVAWQLDFFGSWPNGIPFNAPSSGYASFNGHKINYFSIYSDFGGYLAGVSKNSAKP